MTPRTAATGAFETQPAPPPDASDEEQIRWALARYCYLRDVPAPDQILEELFTEDALMVGVWTIARGHDEIREMVRTGINRGDNPDPELDFGKHPMCHIMTNSVITVVGTWASAVSDLVDMHFLPDGIRLTNSARYEDHFVKTEGVWKYVLKRPHHVWRERGNRNNWG